MATDSVTEDWGFRDGRFCELNDLELWERRSRDKSFKRARWRICKRQVGMREFQAILAAANITYSRLTMARSLGCSPLFTLAAHSIVKSLAFSAIHASYAWRPFLYTTSLGSVTLVNSTFTHFLGSACHFDRSHWTDGYHDVTLRERQLFVSQSTVRMLLCMFENCRSYDAVGGAIYLYESTAWLYSCKFTGCIGTYGGALYNCSLIRHSEALHSPGGVQGLRGHPLRWWDLL
jgi:hypothetical protein